MKRNGMMRKGKYLQLAHILELPSLQAVGQQVRVRVKHLYFRSFRQVQNVTLLLKMQPKLVSWQTLGGGGKQRVFILFNWRKKLLDIFILM